MSTSQEVWKDLAGERLSPWWTVTGLRTDIWEAYLDFLLVHLL